MAGSNMISLKVFLRDDETAEARRFTIDASVVTNFIFLNENLKTVFPILRESVFKITWKDSDGDEITIASDEDIIIALTEMNNSNVKVLYVTIINCNNQPAFTIEADIQEPQFEGPRIICDICNRLVTGFRHKCLQCPDYDLCANCEHQGHHSEHLMVRVPNTDFYMPKCTRKFMHHITRNLKKSAYTASKEAHRAAKFAHKYGPHGKYGAQAESEPKMADVQPGCSSQSAQESCPFNVGEGITLNDVHALGAMARQHFGPILDALRNAPQPTEESDANDGVFMDIIRNAVDGFFGGKAKEQTETSEAPKEDKKENSQAETPMDVEGLNNNKENNNGQQDKRDPGWTFVENNPQPEVPLNEGIPQTQPTAPTAAVPHPNPRIAQGLAQLHEMGFSNGSGYLTYLLERYEGNVNAVVKSLIEMKP